MRRPEEALRGIVRVRPETWRDLADLRRPVVDSEGKLVGLEAFDRVIRRLIEERRRSPAREAPLPGEGRGR